MDTIISRNKMELKDKVIIITGATGGIGSEIAELLSYEGCKLALFARNEERLRDIARELSSDKTECIFKKCDITRGSDVKEAVEFTYNNFGKIDIAIMATGVLIPNQIEDFNTEIIKKLMENNFFGNIYFIEFLLPFMKTQKSGTIAVISALPDKRGVAGWGAFGASKAALSLLMESLRVEAKQKFNINMITIRPGFVQTTIHEAYLDKNSELPRAIGPRKAAEIILNGIKKEKKVIEFPLLEALGSKIRDSLPVSVYDKIPLRILGGEIHSNEKNKYS